MLGSYVQKPTALLYDLSLSPLDKMLWDVINDQSWRTGECNLPHAVLAELIGREPRTLQVSLKRLVDAGLIGQRRIGRTQAKAYWPLNPYGADDQDPPGHTQNSACVPPQAQNPAPVIESHTQKISRTHAGNYLEHTPEIAGLKREDPVNTGEDSPQSHPEPVAGDGAAAPPPSAAPKAPIAVANASSRSKRRDYSKPSDDPADGTLAPETLELPEATYVKWEGEGFTRREIDLQVEAMLAKYGLHGRRYPDWLGAFRQWMAHEALNGPSRRPTREPGRPNGSGLLDSRQPGRAADVQRRNGSREPWTGGIGAPHSVESSIAALEWPELPE